MINAQTDYALVVDDEFNNRDFAEKLLQKAGLKVCSASTAGEALTLAKAIPQLTLALIDHELPDMTGIELVKTLRQCCPNLMLVMATMHDNRQLIDEAFEAGVSVFLIKPNGFIELYRSIIMGGTDILNGDKRYIVDQYGPRLYRGVAAKR